MTFGFRKVLYKYSKIKYITIINNHHHHLKKEYLFLKINIFERC